MPGQTARLASEGVELDGDAVADPRTLWDARALYRTS